MQNVRIVAIETKIAEQVRAELKAPVYGFPALAELAADTAPCRHCLRTFLPHADRRILFTYDRFTGIELLPQPGPVYIHADHCPRYPENGGFPDELRNSPRTPLPPPRRFAPPPPAVPPFSPSSPPPRNC